MMLRIVLFSGLAMASLAACGDDSGGGTGGTGTGGGSTTAVTTTGTTTTGGAGGEDPTGTGGAPGTGGGAPSFDCASYCADVAEACTDGNTQYPADDSCLNACEAFAVGEFEDTDNSLGCRAYHATAALGAPDVHCIHAGPLGDGACSADAGSPCEAFCAIADTICPGAYDSVGACEKVCAGFAPGEFNAGTMPPEDDSLACRMYHLTVAAVSADNAEIHCGHVAGVSETCIDE